jgi:hypothetical protein
MKFDNHCPSRRCVTLGISVYVLQAPSIDTIKASKYTNVNLSIDTLYAIIFIIVQVPLRPERTMFTLKAVASPSALFICPASAQVARYILMLVVLSYADELKIPYSLLIHWL